MPLEAALVGIGGTGTVLCEYGVDTKLQGMMHKILPQIPRHDAKMSYDYPPDGVTFHYTVENLLVYMVASVNEEDSDVTERRIAFAFLDDIKGKFRKRFAGCETKYCAADTLSPSECKEFAPMLAERMKFVEANDQIRLARANVEELTEVMRVNIEKVIDRGQKIEDLVVQTDELDTGARNFRSSARKVKTKMIWRNRKMIALIAFIVFLIIGVIVLYFVLQGDDSAPGPAPAPVPPTAAPTSAPTPVPLPAAPVPTNANATLTA